MQALNTGDTLTDTFTYTVKDPGNLTDTAQLTITINGADDAPVGVNDSGLGDRGGRYQQWHGGVERDRQRSDQRHRRGQHQCAAGGDGDPDRQRDGGGGGRPVGPA